MDCLGQAKIDLLCSRLSFGFSLLYNDFNRLWTEATILLSYSHQHQLITESALIDDKVKIYCA